MTPYQGHYAQGYMHAWTPMFLLLHGFLGNRLRAADILGWTPYEFSGVTSAGDPSSGWGYLPAILVFSAPGPATTVFI